MKYLLSSFLSIIVCVTLSQHKLNVELAYGKSQARFAIANANSIYGSDHVQENYFGNSFYGGLGYNYKFKNIVGLGLTPSVSFIKSSFKLKYVLDVPGAPYTSVITTSLSPSLVYLNLPLYVSFWYKAVSIDLGYQTSVAIKREYDGMFMEETPGGIHQRLYYHSEGDRTNYSQLDFGMFAAVSCNVWGKLDIFSRYYHGLYDITEYYSSSGGIKNRQIVFGVKYNLVTYAQRDKPLNIVPID